MWAPDPGALSVYGAHAADVYRGYIGVATGAGA
jgi:hypothetical protein